MNWYKKAKYGLDPISIIKPLIGQQFVFFDTETTGTDPIVDQITEIAAISTSSPDFQETDTFHRKINLLPETTKRMQKEIEKGNKDYGRVENLLEVSYYNSLQAPTGEEKEVLNDFKVFLDRNPGIIVAHNANFDLYMVARRSGNFPKRQVLDTMMIARMYYIPALNVISRMTEDPRSIEAVKALQSMTSKGKVSSALGAVSRAFNLTIDGWHQAIHDVRSTIAIFKGMTSYILDHAEIFTTPEFKEEYKEKLYKERGYKLRGKGKEESEKRQRRRENIYKLLQE